MCVAPTCPRSSRPLAIAMPIMFTSRAIRRRVDADRLGKRRQPDARRERAGLVVHVDDLRLPLPPGVLEHARLDHVEHVGVAVVVVADVLLVELRQARQLVGRADVLHVPLGHHLLAVRVDGRPQHQDDVVEHRLRRRLVRPADEVVGEERRVLRPGDFGRVQAAVDVDERLAFARERLRLGVGQPLRMRETLPDLAVPIDLRQVLRRRHQREVHRPPLRRLARRRRA